MTSVPDASFLGIPCELRLAIYDLVLDEDVEQAIGHRWAFLKKSTPPVEYQDNKELLRLSPPRSVDRVEPVLRIAWVALLKTCKTTYSEIVAFHNKRHASGFPGNTSYTLSLHPQPPHGFKLGSLTWSQIPCPPQHTTQLIANVHAAKRIMVRGNGGPSPLGLKLFEALNRFIHCGPLLSFDRPLAMPLHLDELVVHLLSSEEYTRGFDGVFQWVEQLAKSGLLVGFVNAVRVRCEQLAVEEVYQVVNEGGNHSRKGWEQYGFQWGIHELS